MPKRYHCPVELPVDVIGGKWRPVILAHLNEGLHRYTSSAAGCRT